MWLISMSLEAYRSPLRSPKYKRHSVEVFYMTYASLRRTKATPDHTGNAAGSHPKV
jgi:hypothetical protein